jgi:hypothetical protein
MAQKTKAPDGNKGGRPTLYTLEKHASVEVYIKNNELPFREEIAMQLGINVNTLKNWGIKHPKFLATMEALDTKQKLSLVRNGLMNVFNARFAQFLLSANHNMKETRVEEKSGVDGEPIKQEVTLKNYESMSKEDLISEATK